MAPITGGDILAGIAGKTSPDSSVSAAQPSRPTSPARPSRDKLPMTDADSVSISKAAGGYVVRGHKDGPSFQSAEAVATTKEERDRLVSGMLGEES